VYSDWWCQCYIGERELRHDLLWAVAPNIEIDRAFPRSILTVGVYASDVTLSPTGLGGACTVYTARR